MKRLVLFLPLIALGGCASVENLNLSPKPAFSQASAAVRPPDFGDETPLALLNGEQKLRVGAPLTDAIAFFGRPRKSYEFRDKPVQFGPEFKSVGWEANGEGYGVIAHEDRLVAAVREFGKVDESRVTEEVERYTRAFRPFEPKLIEGKSARYWFWEVNRDRFMICAVDAPGSNYSLTVAVGELFSMNGLRMNVINAQDDVTRADKSMP